MLTTNLLECCARYLNQSFMLGRLGPEARFIDQEQTGVRQARNQASMLGLRRKILRSRPQAARLLALRREGGAEAGERRSRDAAGGRGDSRPAPAIPRAERFAFPADRPRMVARAGGGDRQGRP